MQFLIKKIQIFSEPWIQDLVPLLKKSEDQEEENQQTELDALETSLISLDLDKAEYEEHDISLQSLGAAMEELEKSEHEKLLDVDDDIVEITERSTDNEVDIFEVKYINKAMPSKIIKSKQLVKVSTPIYDNLWQTQFYKLY